MKNRISLILSLLIAISSGISHLVFAAENLTNIHYTGSGNPMHTLDLYIPDTDNPPLVIWIHGGAWRMGSKDSPSALPIVERGFALASVEFRPASEAPHPAQAHDIKAAIRFLRANASEYGYQADKIAIWGHSSGGHLAALVGLSNDVTELNGILGEHNSTSSSIQAVIAFSGPSNLTTILPQSTPMGLNLREPALEILLDGPMDDEAVTARAVEASPVMQVSADDPPLILIHGIQDPQVPINQSLELERAYEQMGLEVSSWWLEDTAHFAPLFFESPYIDYVEDFLSRHISD